MEAVEVPQPPLGHPEAPGVVHKDEALLDALMIDRGGDVPCHAPCSSGTIRNSKIQQKQQKSRSSSGSSIFRREGKFKVSTTVVGA